MNIPVSGSSRTPVCTGAVAVHVLEIEGDEEEHPEQAHEADHDQRPCRPRPSATGRCPAAASARGHALRAGRTGTRMIEPGDPEAEHVGRQPRMALGLDQPPHDQRRARVPAPMIPGKSKLLEVFGSRDSLTTASVTAERDRAERQVEQEDRLPRDVLHEQTADDRAGGDGQGRGRAPDADRLGQLLGRERRAQDRQRVGISIAPATPWITRKTISTSIVPDSAQPSEPSAKPTMPMVKISRRP